MDYSQQQSQLPCNAMIVDDRSVKVEAAVETIAAMCQQELNAYTSTDVFSQKHLLLPIALDVDPDCRKKMGAWVYQVVDFCKFTRESAEIAMSYLDRFLVTSSGRRALQDRSVYQLAAMTALYTAVKIHEPEAMDPNLVSNLSRGVYSPQDVEQMEYILLHALDWRVNPPTTLSYAREFFHLIPAAAMDVETREMIYDIVKFQTELAVTDYAFVGVRASVIAYCAFMNALHCLDLDPKIAHFVGLVLREAVGVLGEHPMVVNVHSYLLSTLVEHPLPVVSSAAQKHLRLRQQQSAQSSPIKPPPTERRSPVRTISPRSVQL
jgi:hypothetical protein